MKVDLHLKYYCPVWNHTHLHAFITRSPLISGFQSSQLVSKPSANRIQKFLKWPLLTKDSEEQAVISVLSIVRTKAEPVSRSAVWLDWKIKSQREFTGHCNVQVILYMCYMLFFFHLSLLENWFSSHIPFLYVWYLQLCRALNTQDWLIILQSFVHEGL